jgi:hypothetical protein
MSQGHGDKRDRLTEPAIAALLTAPSIEEAAKAVGVSERTLRTWLKDTDFLAAFRDARRAVVETAIAKLQSATGDAVEALRRNLTCGQPAVEIRAALGLIEQSVRAVEYLDLATELAELRRQMAEVRQHGPGHDAERGGEAAGGPGPEAGDGEPALGPAEAGPGPDPDRSEADAGPVADGPATLLFRSGPDVGLQADR